MNQTTRVRSAMSFALILTLGGCGGDSAATPKPTSKATQAPPVQSSDESKSPKFESELLVTHTNSGGTGSSSSKTTRYTDGKPFTAVEDYTSTIRGDKLTVKVKVKFLKHENGADVFDVSSEVETPSGSESKSTTVTYKGEKKTILEDKSATVVIQPPTK